MARTQAHKANAEFRRATRRALRTGNAQEQYRQARTAKYAARAMANGGI